MTSETEHGYLVIADISGYTSFVAGTELEHAHGILSDLLETICMRIESLLTIHKLEGDAVFAYAPEAKITRGETILELVESTYTAFRDRQTNIKHATTCTCNACRNISTLDLKFVVHHGDYIIQHVRNTREMVGSDVNLAHRLLKNHITDDTGWKAYALFTEKSLEHMNMELEGSHRQVEAYEHLGEVITHNINMRERYDEVMAERRVMITDQQADFTMEVDFSTPPPLTWEWLHDPVRRNQWGHGVVWSKGDRPKGRTGNGASNHCAHGKTVSTEIVLDWRPFDYATLESYENGRLLMKETISLIALPDGRTRVHDNIVVDFPLPQWLRRPVTKILITKFFKYDYYLREAARLAGEEMEKMTNKWVS